MKRAHSTQNTSRDSPEKKARQRKRFFLYFSAGNLIQQFRSKPSKKGDEEERAGAESVPQLVQRIREYIQHVEDEKEEDNTQKDYEQRSQKPHWKKAKKKTGPKDKEEDEELKKRFPDGQVSCVLNHDQCIIISLLFSVSAVSKKQQADQAG